MQEHERLSAVGEQFVESHQMMSLRVKNRVHLIKCHVADRAVVVAETLQVVVVEYDVSAVGGRPHVALNCERAEF